MNAYKNASYAGLVLYVFGIILIIYGLVNLGTEKGLDQEGIKTKGTVYDLHVEEPYRQAWVTFKTEDGRTVRFLDKLFWNQDFGTYKKGQVVEVIYDPADPEGTATINEFFQRNTAPWWPFLIGIVVIIVGFIMRKILLKKARIYKGQQNGTITSKQPDYNKSLNRTMLITFAAICIIILIFVLVYGFCAEEGTVVGSVPTEIVSIQ